MRGVGLAYASQAHTKDLRGVLGQEGPLAEMRATSDRELCLPHTAQIEPCKRHCVSARDHFVASESQPLRQCHSVATLEPDAVDEAMSYLRTRKKPKSEGRGLGGNGVTHQANAAAWVCLAGCRTSA